MDERISVPAAEIMESYKYIHVVFRECIESVDQTLTLAAVN